MSDRCWFDIEFRRKDLPKFTEVLRRHVYGDVWWDEDRSDPDDEMMYVLLYEVNYGWTDEILSLAEEGLSFIACHGNGAEYGSCTYACYRGDLVECTSDCVGNPCVPVHSDGIDEAALEQCRKYWELVKKIKEESG